MKKSLLFLVCCLGMVVGRAQSSDCTPSQFILTNYTNDAKRLALYEIYKNQDSHIDSIEIPFSYAYPILEDLQAIQNAETPHPADTIFIAGNFHCLGPINTEGLSLQLDTNFAWVKQWMHGNQITGNSVIDSLMATYGLSMTQFYNYSWGDSYADISVSNPLNIYALCNSFHSVNGVIGAACSIYIGTGIGIIRNDSIGFTEYIFEMGWGDCESGCIYRIRWTFHVYPGCVVDYVSRWSNYHDPNGIIESVENSVSLSPNPATNQLNISIDESLIGAQLNIYNITGALVQTVLLSTANSQLSTANLPNGVYIAEIKTKEARVMRRWVKM